MVSLALLISRATLLKFRTRLRLYWFKLQLRSAKDFIHGLADGQ